MKREDLIPSSYYTYVLSTKGKDKKRVNIEFVDFNKVGNCVFKPIDGLRETQFTLTITHVLTNVISKKK